MLAKDPIGRFIRSWNSPRKRAFWQYFAFNKAKPKQQSEVPKRVRSRLKHTLKRKYGFNRTGMMHFLREGS